jgi:predicted unusual protein kinase regulating ubiquinone biosynthesis (AarF/ABC1/UbiB family)
MMMPLATHPWPLHLPVVHDRRILTMEWVTGVKLTTLPPEEVRDLVGVGQEAFLVQLLEVGFFHGDPHPGNLLKVRRFFAFQLLDCRLAVL